MTIEAKLSEDDGAARDKVTRVKDLRTLRDEQSKDYDVIACIAGRGFKIRREDILADVHMAPSASHEEDLDFSSKAMLYFQDAWRAGS